MRTERQTSTIAIILAFLLVACGGNDSGMGPGQALTMPKWMEVNRSAGTATLEVLAGKTDANKNWNFNGYHHGNARVVVPQGFEVTINFTNKDQLSPHSLGIDERASDFPTTFQELKPAFEGAVTPGAAWMSSATQPGETDTITFSTSKAGDYSMVCYLPGHAKVGMWIYFTVSADGKAGLRKLQG